MPGEPAAAIVYAGALAAVIGGGVALFNSWKSVRWKRAELANSYLKDFNSNPELVFAARCLDWNGGKLVLPENLRPYVGDAKFIEHDRTVFAKALEPNLLIEDLNAEPRFQVYRVAMDSFLSWLCLVTSALDRNLFVPEDIQEVDYWVAKLQNEQVVHKFIENFGYENNINGLVRHFNRTNGSHLHRWILKIKK